VRTILAVVAGAAFAPVDQDYLLQARQMQALSLAVHIPLVCFGIAFPPMVLFADWCHLRTGGDPLFRMLAKRWSKAMIALRGAGLMVFADAGCAKAHPPTITATASVVLLFSFAASAFVLVATVPDEPLPTGPPRIGTSHDLPESTGIQHSRKV
jgi:hypothetical protein